MHFLGFLCVEDIYQVFCKHNVCPEITTISDCNRMSSSVAFDTVNYCLSTTVEEGTYLRKTNNSFIFQNLNIWQVKWTISKSTGLK